MKNLLCILGIHRPLKIMDAALYDSVSKKTAFDARCPCGKRFLTTSFNKWISKRVENDSPEIFFIGKIFK